MKKTIILLSLLLAVVGMQAQNLPEPPNPPRLVNDFAGFLLPDEQTQLEQKLVEFGKQTSTQISILTVADLQELEPSDYATRVFDKWGIGQKEKNNGVLILVKPKTAESAGQVFIAVGYGLEGAVPDALAGRIVDYDILPAFRQGQNYTGIDNAVNTLMGLTKGEFTAEAYLAKHEEHGTMLPVIGIFLIIAIGFIALSSSSKGHTISSSPTVMPPIFFGGMGRRSSGGFGGFSSGGLGGGFGGFGGGCSGGGGAGGSW